MNYQSVQSSLNFGKNRWNIFLKTSIISIHCLLLFLLCSCSGSSPTGKDYQETGASYQVDSVKQPDDDDLKIDSTLIEISDKFLSEHFYGAFFSDRLDTFIIEAPNQNIYGSKIKTLTLFYIDGRLLKSRYVLTENIIARLINNYGRFRIIGCDESNKKVIASKNVLIGEGNTKRLNKDLNNFRAQWSINNSEIIEFRVNHSDIHNPYILVKKELEYDELFASLK